MGAATGLYVVPLYAVIQQRALPARLGCTLGGMYLLNLLFISLSLAAAEALRRNGVEVPALMLGTTLLHAAASIYIFLLLPEFLLRLVMWVLIHTIYRVRASGMENIPDEGAAVIVANHVTYIDPLLIGARIRRPIRFRHAQTHFPDTGYGDRLQAQQSHSYRFRKDRSGGASGRAGHGCH